MIACGLDFGTSNSAIGIARDGIATLVPLEADNILIPSAIFFDHDEADRVLFGFEAIAAHVDQADGRLMRALKSILGSPLIDERTSVGGRNVPLASVVEIFLRHLKRKAEAFAGQEITAVVHGRPVRFDDNDKADQRAQKVLTEIARRVGFRDISFVFEPIAAVHHYERTVAGEELVLVADLGGGTSDFSIVRVDPRHHGRPDRSGDVLATAGLRVGGTDFDAALSRQAAMPLLGLGSRLVEKDLPMPQSPYDEIASWPTINFAYTDRNERELATLVRLSREPRKVKRLLTLVRQRLGHRLAFAVEEAKITLSAAEQSVLPLTFLEPGLTASATRPEFDRAIAAMTDRLYRTVDGCIASAGLAPAAIDTILFTGGSSRVPAVRAAIARAAPSARLAGDADDLLAVPLGLTQMAGQMT